MSGATFTEEKGKREGKAENVAAFLLWLPSPEQTNGNSLTSPWNTYSAR